MTGEVTRATLVSALRGILPLKMQMRLELILFKNVNRHSKDLFHSPHDFSFSNC